MYLNIYLGINISDRFPNQKKSDISSKAPHGPYPVPTPVTCLEYGLCHSKLPANGRSNKRTAKVKVISDRSGGQRSRLLLWEVKQGSPGVYQLDEIAINNEVHSIDMDKRV